MGLGYLDRGIIYASTVMMRARQVIYEKREGDYDDTKEVQHHHFTYHRPL
jgi:hypothetical protein